MSIKEFKMPTAIIEFFSSSKAIEVCSFLLFTILLTAIIGSQNFFFQKVVENGISKRDIVADKTIIVEDTKRTEQHKKEVAQKIEPILTITEDDFIKNNLFSLQNSILKIREKNVPNETKKEELGLLFDITDETNQAYIVKYLLKTNENDLRFVFDKTKLTLINILNSGISEKDYEKHILRQLVKKHVSSDVSKSQITIINALLEQIVVPNLIIDEFATDMARKNAQNAVKPYEVVFEKGDKILFEGEPVTKLKRDALRQAGYNLVELNVKGILGMYCFIIIATLIFLMYLRTFEKKVIDGSQVMIIAILSLILSFIAVLLPTGFSPYILPMPAFIILISVFTNPRIAFVIATLMLSVISLGLHFNIQFITSFTLLNVVASITMAQINFSKRFDLIRSGFYIAVTGLLVVMSIYLLEKFLIDVSDILIIRDSIFVFLNGIVSSIIALGVLPLLENMFRIITPYGLAELADHNQPVLKRLQMEAPGTYHHSLMVANLCEVAAEAIGANPILARVGAFYHDIGKLKRPLFFVENQSYFGIENPHVKLNSRLSKMVITAHTKDGVEIAKEYGLPAIIQGFILQHHGEGLASYFYNQAIAEEGAENVKEEQFRYTGPKPNTKETAILMIADAVESAVRSMKGATAEEIETIIDKIIVERINDRQLEDSPLTLKDLKTIAETFNRILRGMQHKRIKYHENVVDELDKSKIVFPNKIMDKELEDKINKLENNNEKTDD